MMSTSRTLKDMVVALLMVVARCVWLGIYEPEGPEKAVSVPKSRSNLSRLFTRPPPRRLYPTVSLQPHDMQ
jgi:hypothetical protein